MIRKLRWKFVAVCMGLVALVLSAVFGAAYHAVRQNIEDLSRQMLYQVLREDSGRGAVPNPTIEIGGDRVLLPYFTVNIWGDTAYITGGTYADLENTDTLRDILSQCLEQEAAEGTVNEYHLRYLSMDNGLYRKLAFVDMSMEQAVLRRLVRSYLLIALGAMLVLLGIAAAASRWVTRPVEKAWKQQLCVRRLPRAEDAADGNPLQRGTVGGGRSCGKACPVERQHPYRGGADAHSGGADADLGPGGQRRPACRHGAAEPLRCGHGLRAGL